MSGIYGRALNATSPGQAQRHGTLWTIKQWKRLPTLHVVRAMRGILRHPGSVISDVDPHGTIGGHPACIATMGATRDEGQEEQCCESSGGSVGARQSLTERQPGNSVEEGAERLRPSTECFPERRQLCDVLRTMRDVLESVAAHSPDHGSTGPRDEAAQSHSARVHREATTRDRTPLLSARTRENDDAGHAAAEPLLGMLDVQCHRVRCSTCRPGEIGGCRREHGSRWDDESAGTVKGRGPGGVSHLINESGQRPENQITALGLVSRQKVESGEQVTEFFNIPEGFFNCMYWSPNRQSRFLAGCVWSLKGISMKCARNEIHSQEMQHENLDVRSVGTTRPLRGVAMFDETCDLTDEDAQEATVRACSSVNSGIIIVGIPRRATSNSARRCVHGNTNEVPFTS